MPSTATVEEQIKTSQVDPRYIPEWKLPQPPSPKKIMTRDIMEFLPHVPAVAFIWRVALHVCLAATIMLAWTGYQYRGMVSQLAGSTTMLVSKPFPRYVQPRNLGDHPMLKQPIARSEK
jgi:hypothetical protein